ncbi:conjugal transfer protein TrbM [Alcaligenaceae bacterium]|uniref:TrbM/KikA/MpfK family conjugal transfer protein n=1 Tax=Pusillimonas sp. (strain T7-7) TaxID=1007105 RepID=UPI00067441A9|nr:TrbM/KikA/MpfK family conjugal transfer protein [Pusillimonas sp. T7-7]NYT59836.1 conjugal transfer protein TrbM [Alcaligenaceae bacterium]
MQTLPALRAGALALACVLAPVAHAADTANLLTGIPRLACEATLCLSSSLRPGECSPSLDHYFDLRKYNKHGLDWSATVSARRSFLSQCPASGDSGMSERIDAISRGAGKCDAEFLNQTYAATAYKWRKREYGGDSGQTVYEVHPLPTVTLDQLPTYCVVYNDHAWTYELSVRYVGRPTMGGHWVKAEEYEAAQAKWDADHSGLWAKGWNFSLTNPRHRRGH